MIEESKRGVLIVDDPHETREPSDPEAVRRWYTDTLPGMVPPLVAATLDSIDRALADPAAWLDERVNVHGGHPPTRYSCKQCGATLACYLQTDDVLVYLVMAHAIDCAADREPTTPSAASPEEVPAWTALKAIELGQRFADAGREYVVTAKGAAPSWNHPCANCQAATTPATIVAYAIQWIDGSREIIETCNEERCIVWARNCVALATDTHPDRLPVLKAPTAEQMPEVRQRIDSITLDAEGGLRLEEIGYDGPGQYARQLGCTCRDFHNARSEDGVLEAQHEEWCVLRDWRIRARRGDLQVVGVDGVVMPAGEYTRMVYGEETAERLRERNNALVLNAAAKRAADPLPRPPRPDGFSQAKIDEIKATMLASGKRGGR